MGHGGTRGKGIKCVQGFVGSLKEIDRLDDLDVDGRIILCYNIIMDPEGTESVGVK